MTLIIQKPTGAKLNLRKTWQPMDADAAAYITAVETADGQALEEKTKIAIDNFVLGCKADGIWTAIKASCILAGARTLTGALVPLVGATPTNFNFVSDNYNRKTGLGDSSNTAKYLDTNRNNNADPQDNNHMGVYVSWGGGSAIGTEAAVGNGTNNINVGNTRNRNTIAVPFTAISGFVGTSRNSSTGYTVRNGNSSTFATSTSQTPSNSNVTVFRLGTAYGASRVAFYSIGEFLDLALLDARVTDLINAFDTAI